MGLAAAVRFAMDRAGMVGADGATHCGAFDITFMASLPHMVTMAPSNEAELINMVATATAIDDRPSCFRFPRGNGQGLDLSAHGITKDLKGTPLEVGAGAGAALSWRCVHVACRCSSAGAAGNCVLVLLDHAVAACSLACPCATHRTCVSPAAASSYQCLHHTCCTAHKLNIHTRKSSP